MKKKEHFGKLNEEINEVLSEESNEELNDKLNDELKDELNEEDLHATTSVNNEGPLEKESELLTKKPILSKNLPIYIIGYFIYVIIFIPITIVLTLLDEVNTNSGFYLNLFKRKNYYTTFFSFGKLILWCLCCLAGFTFVTLVTLKRERQNPFLSRHGTYKDIIILAIVAPVLYFTAPIIFLRDRNDMQRGCLSDLNQENIALYSNDQNFQNDNYIDITSISDFISNFSILYTDALQEPTVCHPYNMWQAFFYNYTFVLVFFIGLNYTHLDKIPIPHLSLKRENMKKWNWKQYTFVSIVLTIIFANVIAAFVMYYQSGILFMYLGVIAGVILFLVIVSLLLRKTHYFHLHHYTWAGFFMIL